MILSNLSAFHDERLDFWNMFWNLGWGVDTCQQLDCIAVNGRMIDELERIWECPVMASLRSCPAFAWTD
jgi:hypothetical protein